MGIIETPQQHRDDNWFLLLTNNSLWPFDPPYFERLHEMKVRGQEPVKFLTKHKFTFGISLLISQVRSLGGVFWSSPPTRYKCWTREESWTRGCKEGTAIHNKDGQGNCSRKGRRNRSFENSWPVSRSRTVYHSYKFTFCCFFANQWIVQLLPKIRLL